MSGDLVPAGVQSLQRLRNVIDRRSFDGNCSKHFLRQQGITVERDDRGKRHVHVVYEPEGMPLMSGKGGLVSASRPPASATQQRKMTSCGASWRQDGHLSKESLLSVLRDVASALFCLHAAGFAHGDLKPDQVILDCTTGEDGRRALTAILVDYDTLMPIAHDGAAEPHEGMPWDVVTKGYCSPERKAAIETAKVQQRLPLYNAVEDDVFALLRTVEAVREAWKLQTGERAPALDLGGFLLGKRAKALQMRERNGVGAAALRDVVDAWERAARRRGDSPSRQRRPAPPASPRRTSSPRGERAPKQIR